MSRVIRKSQSHSASEAAYLLAALFSAELSSPSECIWLVSPWISDVELVDNRAGTFASFNSFGRRRIRLAEILVALMDLGTRIVVATTSDVHNDAFLSRLATLSSDRRVTERLSVAVDEENRLHTKALTGDDYALVGSMNITRSGIEFREEYLELRTDPEYVAQARMDAFDAHGGVL
jgi:phosphatidylserine/phosphatidylglycerophosphate/cardiolipin synthase-like enzyme